MTGTPATTSNDASCPDLLPGTVRQHVPGRVGGGR